MESFFDFLPGIIAVLVILGKGFKKIIKLADKEFPINEPVQTEVEANNQTNRSINKKEEAENLDIEITKSSAVKERKRPEKSDDKKIKSSKKIKDKIKTSENKIFNNKKIKRKEVIQGIIYKEIIDKPRAKRPHQFF